ncbi:hypothetical protein GCM10010254_24580 [Streptomyces chromofuscus]|nr:hypothetical protein GCM10010254_24580 [Streptomyces chromofuscus]
MSLDGRGPAGQRTVGRADHRGVPGGRACEGRNRHAACRSAQACSSAWVNACADWTPLTP